MTVLTNRQQLARNLANELGRMNNVWVTSPLPLDEQQKLRLQIVDTVRNEVIQILKDWGWEPQFVSILPRVCHTGLQAACLYEIDLPRERQPIVDDRIQGEIVDPAKKAAQKASIEAMRIVIYGKKGK